MNYYPMSYSNRRQYSPSRRKEFVSENKFVSNFKIHNFQVFGDSLAVMLWQGANINDREVQESDYIRGCDSGCYSENLFSQLVRTEGRVPPQILLAVGYNESISMDFNPKKLFYHIEYIINQIKKRGCQDVVLTNIPPSPCINTRACQFRMLGANPNWEVLQYWRNLQEINKKIQDLAVQQKNVHLCDVFNKFCFPISGNRSDDYVIENQVSYVVEMHKFVCFKPNERPCKGEQHLITFTREGKAVLFKHVQNTLIDLEYYIFLENDKKRKKLLLQTNDAAVTAEAPSETRREDCFTLISSEEDDEEDSECDREKKKDDSNAKASKSRSASVCIVNSPSRKSPNRSRAPSRSRRRSTFRNSSPPERSSCRNPSPRRRHRSRSRTSFTPLYRKSRSKSRVHSRASSSNMKFTVSNHSPSSDSSSYPIRYSPSAHSKLSRSRSPPFRLSKSRSSHFRRSQSRSPFSRQSQSQSPLFIRSQSRSPLSIRSQSQSREERSASYLEYNVPPSQSPLNDGEGSEECLSSNLSHTDDIVCVEDDDDQLYNPVSDDLNESGKEHEGDNVPPPTDSNAPSTSTSTVQARGLPLVVCDNTCTCPKCEYNIAEFVAGFTEVVDELCSKYGF